MNRIVYISHRIHAPTLAGIEANLADLRRIVRNIFHQYRDVIPFVPYYVYVVSLNDHDDAERALGQYCDLRLLTSGIVTEMWLTGPELSAGMAAEVGAAMAKGITITDMLNKL